MTLDSANYRHGQNRLRGGRPSVRRAASRLSDFKGIAASSSLVVGARVVGSVAGFATQILLARMIGADALGIFFISISLALVMCTICTLGYPWIIAPIVAESEAAGGASRLKPFMKWARRDVFYASIGLGTLAVLGIILLPGLSGGARICFVLGALTAPIFAWMRINGALANARKQFLLAYSPDLFLRPALLLLLVTILWLSGWSVAVWVLVALHLLLVLSITLGQAKIMFRNDGGNYGGFFDRFEIGDRDATVGERRIWRRQAVPMMIAMLFIGVFADLDILLASLFLNDAHTAVLGVCLKLALFLAFAVQAVHSIILRDASDAVRESNHADLNSVLFRANALSVLGSLVAFGGVLVFGRQTLLVFGPEFEQGYWCLVILVCAQLVRAMAGPATQILAITGHQRASMPVFAIGLCLLMVTNALLVPFYGLIGAAVAVLIVTAFWSLGLAFVARRKSAVSVTIFGSLI